MSSGNPACKPYVIAVAAVSGGGKTSVVTALKERLPNAAAQAYLQMLSVVLPSSDVSVDGTLPLNEITEELLGRLYTLRSERSEGYDNHEGS